MGERAYRNIEVEWGKGAYGVIFMMPSLLYFHYGDIFLVVSLVAFNVLAIYIPRPIRFLFINDLLFRFFICLFFFLSIFLCFTGGWAGGGLTVIPPVILSGVTYIFMWAYKPERKLKNFGWEKIEN
ncbi:MAG: hypothetical protein ABGX87_11675 [Alcanivorax sp.]|uniref:hypothetical protein n=1 Tax=Alloalcanivorax marinus TaxID=1177169 RepID=UPI001958147E|nr:hypothetical protein [Alloalcanivorax marinus]MBM7335094.1 hypothetical protein [Alloalcanivorax marinus]